MAKKNIITQQTPEPEAPCCPKGKQKKKHFADKESALKVARKVREQLALGDCKIAEEEERRPFSDYFRA